MICVMPNSKASFTNYLLKLIEHKLIKNNLHKKLALFHALQLPPFYLLIIYTF